MWKSVFYRSQAYGTKKKRIFDWKRILSLTNSRTGDVLDMNELHHGSHQNSCPAKKIVNYPQSIIVHIIINPVWSIAINLNIDKMRIAIFSQPLFVNESMKIWMLWFSGNVDNLTEKSGKLHHRIKYHRQHRSGNFSLDRMAAFFGWDRSMRNASADELDWRQVIINKRYFFSATYH